jgi:hypothetical protein
MVTTTERIQVIIEAINRNFSRIINTVQKNLVGMQRVAGLTQKQFKKLETVGGGLNNRFAGMNTVLGRATAVVRKATAGFRGFRMEMLGVMFFGMAMSKMFSDMLRPAAKIFNIFELWSTTLSIVFLPTMAAIFPFLLKFMEFFMNLPEPTKRAIGLFTIIGLILGKILFITGVLALGLGSLFGTTLPKVLAKAALSVTRFFSLFVKIGLRAFGIISIIVLGFVSAWKTNFGRIRDFVKVIFEGIKNIVVGHFKIISGIIDIVVGIFTLNFEKIKLGWMKVWTGIKSFTVGIVQTIIGILATIGLSVFRVIVGAFNLAIKAINLLLPKKFEVPILKTREIGGFERKLGNISNVTINQTINATTSNKEEIDALMRENNAKLVEDVKRLTGA